MTEMIKPSQVTEIMPRIYVTKTFGRTLENLELLWFLRDEAQRRLNQHMNGVHLSGEEWAAVNTPDEMFDDPNANINPEWKKIKDDWFAEGCLLLDLMREAQRRVRIATGHEPVKKLCLIPREKLTQAA